MSGPLGRPRCFTALGGEGRAWQAPRQQAGETIPEYRNVGAICHTWFMPVKIAIPTWVVPSSQAMHDVHWLAAWWVSQRASAWAAGIGAALSWVVGESDAPVTARATQPVTITLVCAEHAAAMAVDTDADKAPFPLAAEYARLDVPYAAPMTTNRERARGAQQCLDWLRGARKGPPFPIPVRGADGHVLTAPELYDLAMAPAPWEYELPEQHKALLIGVARQAALSASLAQTIEKAKRQSVH